MTLPVTVARSVEAALEDRYRETCADRSCGSCRRWVHQSFRSNLTDSGDTYFLKWNPSSPPEMFQAEADGLQALRYPGDSQGAGGAGNGRIRHRSRRPVGSSWSSFLRGAPPDYGPLLGAGLAALHAAGPGEKRMRPNQTFGWHRTNFIGSLPQDNGQRSDWVTFWHDLRLEPQLRMARNRGHFTGGGGRVLDDLLARLDDVLPDAVEEGPALLHGDLWSGNFYPDSKGDPVLIDPAVYRGVGEVDLAMMELFGSFPRGFAEGYEEKRILAPEYDAFRRDLYQLYYLLVHVNLFGGGYVGGSLAAANRALGAAEDGRSHPSPEPPGFSPTLPQRFHSLPQPVDGFLQQFVRGSVAHPHVPVISESHPRHHGEFSFLQEPCANRAGVGHPLSEEGVYPEKEVEGPIRFYVGKLRKKLLEEPRHQVPSSTEGFHHLPHLGPGPVPFRIRRQGSLLGWGRRVGGGVALEGRHLLRQFSRGVGEPDAPTRHGKGLGDTVHQDEVTQALRRKVQDSGRRSMTMKLM